jgi:protein-disulfide isomerase
MQRGLNFLLTLLLLTTLAGAQQETAAPHATAKAAQATSLPSEETVNAFFHEWFGYDPSLTWKIASIKPSEAQGLAEVDVVLSNPKGQQSSKLYITEDGKHAVIGDVMPFGTHPFLGTQKELEKGLTGPTHGPADAPVTVVEFSDLQCPHCKDAQPTLDKLMAEKKNGRVVFQSFPLPMHECAAKAANYADCVSRSSNEAFWKFIQGVYGAQSDITAANADEKLTALADGSGVKGADIAVCSAKAETTTRIEKSLALGKQLEVDSTPTLFINGRKVPSVPYEVLEKLVDFAATDGARAAK